MQLALADECGKYATKLVTKDADRIHGEISLDSSGDLIVRDSSFGLPNVFVLNEIFRIDETGVVVKIIGWAKKIDAWFPIAVKGEKYQFIDRSLLRPMWELHKELNQKWLYAGI